MNATAVTREQRLWPVSDGLGTAHVNSTYFRLLYRAFRRVNPATELRLFDPRIGPADSEPRTEGLAGRAASSEAFSTAIAPDELLAELPSRAYSSLAANGDEWRAAARETFLWLRKMHAGTGTSFERRRYLANRKGIETDEVRLGAKSTDLFIELPGNGSVSLAEAQLIRAMGSVDRGSFAGLLIQDLVSEQTEPAVRALWHRPSRFDASRSYARLVEEDDRFLRLEPVVQAMIPTVDEAGELSVRRRAPGGHGFFAIEMLLRLATSNFAERYLPPHPVVAALSNGEDLNSSPDELMVGWMVRNEIPIVLVTTEKTGADRKGGQLVLRPGNPGIEVGLFEVAQAEASGQRDLFEALGVELRRDGRTAAFNTNLALFNVSALLPRLRRLGERLGERRFLQAITPDLVRNVKRQRDPDGAERAYTQLEGTLASSLLNLDAAARRELGSPLVHFIEVEKRDRSRFFCPIKTAFDFFLQFESDRFELDASTMILRDTRGGALPTVKLDENYRDLADVLDAFRDASVRELDSLEVKGRFDFGGTELRGNLKLENRMPERIYLRDWVGGQGCNGIQVSTF